MIRWTLVLVMLLPCTLSAHDSWVETNTNLVRTGDAIYVDLKLGNHGNDHRDFKLAGKLSLEGATLEVYSPDGNCYDLKDKLFDVGYAPAEGYWTAKFVAVQPGLYLVSHTSDRVVHYAPTRSIKSGKAFFVASPSLDKVSVNVSGFDRVLGHPLELVPVSNPVVPMGPGKPIAVRLLFNGKPLAGARVSFIPRGATLAESFDAEYERMTDSEGCAQFVPRTGSAYLIVAHHQDPNAAGPNYTSTKYSATLVVLVPELCACCAE